MLDKQYEKQQETIEDLKAYIRKYGAGQRAKQAHDRERKLARIEQVERMRDIEGPIMGFGGVERSGDIVIEARKLSKAYDTPLFRDFDAVDPPRQVRRDSRAQRIGQDNARQDADRPAQGRFGRAQARPQGARWAFTTRASRRCRPRLRWSAPFALTTTTNGPSRRLRDLLARFGLKGDIVFQTVGKLSGGERGKAALARLAASESNLLVMDEPTNHLDIWSCDALERSIREFEGTVLVVSHDRWFLNQVADMIIVLGDGKARLIEGNYETYQRLVQVEKERADRREASKVAPEPAKKDSGKTKCSRKFAYRKSADLEIDIAERERDIADLEDLLGQPATYRDPISCAISSSSTRTSKRVWKPCTAAP